MTQRSSSELSAVLNTCILQRLHSLRTHLVSFCSTSPLPHLPHTQVSSPTSFGGDLRSPGCHELDVAHLEDGGQQLEHVSDLLLAEFHHFQGLLHRPTQHRRSQTTCHHTCTDSSPQPPTPDMTVIKSHLFLVPPPRFQQKRIEDSLLASDANTSQHSHRLAALRSCSLEDLRRAERWTP